MVGMTHPMIAQAMRAAKIKKFSGKAEDFEQFRSDWELHLQILHSSVGGTLPDLPVLGTLLVYLDNASSTRLRAKLRSGPGTSYNEFWAQLKDKYQKDVRTIHRQNWQLVKAKRAGARTTSQEWEEYMATYWSLRELVDGWDDAEDRQLVFRQIPPEYQLAVIRETDRRRAGRRWIWVGAPDGVPIHQLRTHLEWELGTTFEDCEMGRRHFIVKCPSEHLYRELMDYEGGKVDGKAFKVQPTEYCMSGDEMLEYIKHLLGQADEVSRTCKSYGCPEAHLRIEGPPQDDRAVFAMTAPTSPKGSETESFRGRQSERA